MLRQRVEAALEVPARTLLAMHRHARDRARRALPGLDHGREGRIVAFLALPAFARLARLASAFGVARAVVAASGACRGARRLDDRSVLADDDRVAHAGQILRVAEHAQKIEAAERARR